MKHNFIFKSIFLLVLLLSGGQLYSQEKQYEATWESLKSKPYPEWFKEAKLGIFIHWGVYSVPAYSNKEDYGEWYLRGHFLI